MDYIPSLKNLTITSISKTLSDKIKAHTVLFIIIWSLLISIGIYHEYIFANRLFIFLDVGSDTHNSYLPLIKMKTDLLEHFTFYTFTWGIGENILKNRFLFDLFSMPQMFMNNDESLLKSFVYVMIAKHVLASVLFYKFIETYNYTRFSKIIVSIIFGYIGFMVIWGQHYMFSSSVVYFILTLWGFERWLIHKKYLLFIFSVAYLLIFSLVTSFYFFIFLLFYAPIRYIYLYDLKMISTFFFKTLGLVIISFLLSSIIVIPTLMTYLSSPRISGSGFDPSTFFIAFPFGLNHILTAILRFFSNDILGTINYYHLNVPFVNPYDIGNLYSGILSIFLLPLIFLKTSKKEKILFTIVIIITYLFLNNQLFILLMSAYSKIYEFRYGFLFSIILLIALGKSISHIQKYGFPSVSRYLVLPIIILPTITLYVGLQYMHWTIEYKAIIKFYIILITFLMVYIYLLKSNINQIYIQFIFIVVLTTELILASYATVNDRSALHKDVIQKKGSYFDDTSKALAYLKKNDNEPFYRIIKNYKSVNNNDAMYQNYYGVSTYSSLKNKYYYNLFKKILDLPDISNSVRSSADTRVTGTIQTMYLNSLLSTKYILSKTSFSESALFTLIKKVDSIFIYKNKNYLPFGVLYTSYIKESDAPKNSRELEKTMYMNLIAKSNSFDSSLENTNIDINMGKRKRLNYKIGKYADITELKELGSHSFNFTSISNDPRITFHIESESMINVSFDVVSNTISRGQLYYSKSNKNFNNKNMHQFYIKKGKTTVNYNIYSMSGKIRLDAISTIGSVSIKNLKISKIETLQHNFISLKIDSFNNDHILGTINTIKKGIVLFQIPFDKGWDIYLDGEKSKIQIVDFGLMGIEVPKGKHSIELRYMPHNIQLGIILTLIGLILLLLIKNKMFRKEH